MNSFVPDDIITLYKSLSPMQLADVVSLNWRAFPPFEGDQRIFAPKLHREYAEMLARQLEMASYQAGFVVSFHVHACFLQQFERGSVAYSEHEEYRIPVSAMAALNRSLVGKIELVSGFANHYTAGPGYRMLAAGLALDRHREASSAKPVEAGAWRISELVSSKILNGKH